MRDAERQQWLVCTAEIGMEELLLRTKKQCPTDVMMAGFVMSLYQESLSLQEEGKSPDLSVAMAISDAMYAAQYACVVNQIERYGPHELLCILQRVLQGGEGVVKASYHLEKRRENANRKYQEEQQDNGWGQGTSRNVSQGTTTKDGLSESGGHTTLQGRGYDDGEYPSYPDERGRAD